MIQGRLSYHVNESSRGVEVCNGSPRRIPSPRVVVVATVVVVGVAAAATVTVAGGGGLIGQYRECKEVAAP